jgi:hypothetical protein
MERNNFGVAASCLRPRRFPLDQWPTPPGDIAKLYRPGEIHVVILQQFSNFFSSYAL